MRGTAILGLTAALLAALPARAETYVASSHLGPATPAGTGGYVLFPEAVREASNGEIDFQAHHGAGPMPPRAHLDGIRDGVAQMGQITPLSSDLPLQRMLADLAFARRDPLVAAFAVTEMNLTDPRLLAEWKRNGVIFGGGYAAPAAMLICRDRVKTLDDVKGRKVRAGGGVWDRVVEHLGGVPTSVPSSDTYAALATGRIDCTADGAGVLTTARLREVARSVNTAALGLRVSGALWAYDKEFWASLRPDQRRLLFDEMARHIVKTQMIYSRSEVDALAEARRRGVRILKPAEDLQEAIAAFAAADVAAVERIARQTHGIEDPRALIDAFDGLVEKWTTMLRNVSRGDEAALVALMKAEIYDKLDETTYGVN